MEKKEVIRILKEIAILLELKGENPYKVLAYKNAARRLESLPRDIQELIATNALEKIQGIGKALAEKIRTLMETGNLPYYNKLKESTPEGLWQMLEIPGLGPRKVKSIYDQLGIQNIGELEYACKENRLRDLPGFGPKTQEKILQAIELRRKYNQRFHISTALEEAEALITHLRRHPHLGRLEIAGSLRRRYETIKDIDVLGCCAEEDREKIMEHFSRYRHIERLTSRGRTKSSAILKSGINCDLRLVDEHAYPFALQYFTGSKEHNTRLRQIAKSKGWLLNEYGLFERDQKKSIVCRNEKEIYRALGLAYIPPELREDMGEVEAAANGALPALISEQDLQGILHVHSHYSDGSQSIEELARVCMEMGYQYLGICDHSKSAYYANGLNEERIRTQHEEIDAINARLHPFKVFKGIEVDILTDGSLDYEEDTLAKFDFIIASIHSSFHLSETQMTERICKALRHPMVTMLGHPSGRLLLGREAYALNMEKVLETAAEYKKIIEINANPHRLDLDWRWVIKARRMGILFSINPDAHSIAGLEDIRYGVWIARKGWLEVKDVINTYPVSEIQDYFAKK